MNATDPEHPYRSNLRLALSGLVPLVFLELLAKHRHPILNPDLKPSDLIPEPEERERLVAVLIEADLLAAGGVEGAKQHARRGSQLTALAKAIVALACCPGGVPFLGVRYEVRLVPRDSEKGLSGGLVLDEREEKA